MTPELQCRFVQNRSDPPPAGGEPVGLVPPDTGFSAEGKTEKQNNERLLCCP